MKIINPNFISSSVSQFIKKMPFKFGKLLILCLFIFTGCKKEFVSESPVVSIQENSPQEAKNYQEGEIVLGKQLENPYTIENMKKAYDKLNARNSNGKLSAETQEIKTTHLYIRWLPKSWDEYDELKNDKKLLLYEIPLDYEVKVNGNKYHDKSIPEDLPTWQYTVIEKDYKFNKKIKYEILAEAYIPEKDTELKKKGGRLSAGFSTDELINEALILTNNQNYLIPLDSKKARVSAWRPAGRVTVRDTRLYNFPYGVLSIGVQGVYVRAKRFLSIESGVTDANGYYVAGGTFGGGADYSLYWEAPDFDVRSGSLGQAWVNGPHLASDWNPYFVDGVDRFYAHVFRGAWRYFYGNIDGLKRPNFNWNYKLAAFNSGKNDHCNRTNFSLAGAFNNINIYRYENNSSIEWDSDELFSATIHEICHGVHANIKNQGLFGNYATVSDFIAESWPVAVEHFLTQKEYKSRGISNYAEFNYSQPGLNYPLNSSFQYWRGNEGTYWYYSPLFIDLIDTYNQQNFATLLPFQLPYINENISGYTMGQIESSIIPAIFDHNSCRILLKQNKPNGITDSMIDNFIGRYVQSNLP